MSARYLGALRCPRCDRAEPEASVSHGCGHCARSGVGVNLVPAYEIAPGVLPRRVGEPGIFGFRDLLPLGAGDAAVSLGEGSTPLLSLDRLGPRLGLRQLVLKDEARNPTWSYKDRLAAVAVTKAAAGGASTVVVASTGNHGAAVAAYAAAADLQCVVLTLTSVPQPMRVLMQAFGATVVAYDHGPDRWSVMRAAVDQFGWVPISGLMNPPIGSNSFGVDGYKTIAYELWDQIGDTPDVVVMPAAYGDGLAGVERGFADLVALGVANRTPRLVGVDPFGAYAHGVQSEEGALPTVPVAPSMAFSVATPIATYQGVQAIRATDGTAVAAPSNDAIAAMQLELAATEGLYVEGSAALTLLAVQELADRKWIAAEHSVVVVSTSTGLKDPASTAQRLGALSVLEPTLLALEAALPPGRRP